MPSAYMHAHTTVMPFIHELHIACKNVLISYSSMMHAYACCTSNHIVFKELMNADTFHKPGPHSHTTLSSVQMHVKYIPTCRERCTLYAIIMAQILVVKIC